MSMIFLSVSALADTKIADSTSNLGATSVLRTPDGVLEVVGGNSNKPTLVLRGADSTASSGSTTGGTTPNMVVTQTGLVGIGTTTPQGVMDINSTTGTLVPPRMTTAQRSALVAPPSGAILFNTDTQGLEVNTGTAGSPNWNQTTTSSWSAPQALSFTSTGVMPTGINFRQNMVRYRTLGNSTEVDIRFITNSASSNGSGEYVFTLPAGLSFNTSIYPTTSAGAWAPNVPTFLHSAIPSVGTCTVAGAGGSLAYIIPLTTTTFRVHCDQGGGTYNIVSSAWFGMNGVAFMWRFLIN